MTERSRIAVFGAGLVGRRHIELVQSAAGLAAIADPAPEAAELASDLGVPWFSAPEDCLTEAKPDGVIIATPNQLHAEHALASIRAGVPVLIEKPITDRSETALPVLQEAEARGIPVLVGHHRRHNLAIARAKNLIDAGEIGEIVAVMGQFWLYKPDDYFDAQWRQSAGAGPVFINLIHDIDLLRHLVGEVRAVQAVESRSVRNHEVEDTAAVLIEFENGALGTFSVSDTVVAPWSWEFSAGENAAYPNVPGHAYRIGGTEASLTIPDLTIWRHPGPRSWWEPIAPEQISVAGGNVYTGQLQHFLEVVQNRTDPLVTGRDALRSLQVIEAIKQAASLQRRVEV